MRKKRKREHNRKILSIVLPVVLLVIALMAVMVWKVFVVKEVDIQGNQIYEDQQIEEWVLNDEYSWNSLYVYFTYKFKKQETIPFVDSMDVKLLSPSKLQVTVMEKGVLGYIYLPTSQQNVYFDKDGYVVEISPDVIEGTMKINGLQIGEPALYEKLDLENESILRTLLSLTQLLKKFDHIPDLVYIDGSRILLVFDTVQVNLGTGSSLNEKILRMDQILPQIKGKTGTLHLDTWNKSNTDIYFKQGELTDIPSDGSPIDESIKNTVNHKRRSRKDNMDTKKSDTDDSDEDSDDDYGYDDEDDYYIDEEE